MRKAIVVGVFSVNLFINGIAPRLTTAQASPQAVAASCTLSKGLYICDWQAFRVRFAQAHTIAIQAEPMQRATEKRLRELVEALGKSVAAPEQSADLTIRVLPANQAGIEIGPADQALATLQVLTRAEPGSRGTLLWAETYVGQADRPWPTVVNAVADQFQARFGRHRW